MHTLFFIIICSFIFSSCTFTSSSGSGSDVNIVVNPFGPNDKIRSFQPFLRIKSQSESEEEMPCRPRPFSLKDLKQILENDDSIDIDQDYLDSWLDLEETEQSSQEQANSPRNLKVVQSIQGSWTKIGLKIENANKEFFLVIESIAYFGRARYKGQQFSLQGTINPSDCQGEGGDLPPFLYFIPPARQVEYKPLSGNPLENLTIYIEGFEVIDPSQDPSCDSQRETNQQSGIGVSAVLNTSDNQTTCSDRLIIPKYTIELSFIGYFKTKSGIRISQFRQRVFFDVIPSQ